MTFLNEPNDRCLAELMPELRALAAAPPDTDVRLWARQRYGLLEAAQAAWQAAVQQQQQPQQLLVAPGQQLPEGVDAGPGSPGQSGGEAAAPLTSDDVTMDVERPV